MDLVEQLFSLWLVSPDGREDPLGDFGALYRDPVVINGTPMSLTDLVERARSLHTAFSHLSIEVVEHFESEGKVAVAFRQEGLHVGPLATPTGVLAPTGRRMSGVGIDLLTVEDGRITSIWVLADELQRLGQLGWPTSPRS